ncbi:MAG: hypothetical protein HKN03_13505 [Acidimicrobiales bacterium]|nr:hypothetical protein [Acidimicrobiales bacterium]
MFNVGGGELLLICVLALVVVGPEQLPGLLRKLGQYAGQAKQMSDSLRAEFMAGAEPFQESIREFQQGMNDFSNTVTENADVRNWGAGTADDPIVPRGFADQASSQPGDESSSTEDLADAEAITAPDRSKKLEITPPVNPWAPLPGSGADSQVDPATDPGEGQGNESRAGTVADPGTDTDGGFDTGAGSESRNATEPTVDEQAEAAARKLANRGRGRTVIPPIAPFSSFPPADTQAGDHT